VGVRSLAGIVAWLTITAPAMAQPQRVVLVQPGATLREATLAALAPWHIEIRATKDALPGATMPAAAHRARAIARRRSAGAVVWISRAAAGRHALWLYATQGDHVVAQPLAATLPLDDAAAASVALSIKTLLRHSTVAPPTQRFAAHQARGARARGRVSRRELESVAGMWTRGSHMEPRLGLTALWWPTDRAGVGAAVRAGPGVAVTEPTFGGRFTDIEVALVARARIPLPGGLALLPELSAALHRTSLDGAVLVPQRPTHITRADPAAGASVTLRRHVAGRLELGVRAGATYLLRRQRYLVRGAPVYTLASTQWELALAISLPL